MYAIAQLRFAIHNISNQLTIVFICVTKSNCKLNNINCPKKSFFLQNKIKRGLNSLGPPNDKVAMDRVYPPFSELQRLLMKLSTAAHGDRLTQ